MDQKNQKKPIRSLEDRLKKEIEQKNSYKNKSQDQHEGETEYFSELPSSSSSRSTKRNISPSPFAISTERNQQELNDNLNKKKIRSDSKKEETTKSSLSISEHSRASSLESPSHQKLSLPVPIQSSENVLDIPEILRHNFGTSDFELGECPIGLEFWFDSENSHCTKFFLKLHDDSGNWKRDRTFVLMEQIGLCYPKSYLLNFNEILEKLKNSTKKRIWLHVRDFTYIFSPSGQKLFGNSFEKSITHFSFGTALYSKAELKTNLLLDFIFGHLPSLEYLSVNSKMLSSFDTHKEPKNFTKMLHKLQTLRLINTKSKLSLSFISMLLKSSPNLKHLYGIPLDYLNILMNKKNEILKDHVEIRTVFIQKNDYSQTEKRALNFQRDLQLLARLENWNNFEQFEAQLYFLHTKFPTFNLSRCVKAMSTILQRHKNSIRKLKLEPFTSINEDLKLSPMNNLTTLQFDLNRRDGFEKQEASFFPKGFDFIKHFPSLNSVEILMDFSNPNFRAVLKKIARDSLDKLFPSDIFKRGEFFNRVKSLTLHGFALDVVCMPKLAHLFPNVKVCRLRCGFFDAGVLLPHFYSLWPGLEQLHLEIDLDTREGNLDAPLSGMDKERCSMIQYQNSTIYRITDEEKFQEHCKRFEKNPSIRSMKNLQLLNFVLCAEAGGGSKVGSKTIFSRIGASAISQVGVGKGENKLQVHVSFDERTTTKEKEEIMSTHSSIFSLPFITLNR